MGDISLYSLRAILPDLYLCVMALFLLMVTVNKCKLACNAMIGGTFFTLAGTAWFLLPHLTAPAMVAFNGMFIADSYTTLCKLLIITAAALALMLSGDWLKEGERKPSEYFVLMLFSVLGLMLMVSANDLLTIYMALEMSSLALYVLASFDRDHAKSSEAGLKYFMLGALASGMMLFGMSLVYGFAGTTSFDSLSTLFAAGSDVSKGVVVGLILVMVGFCFKLSAVPFHMWTPDVYEGAPTPVTAFFATAPKIGAFALFARFLIVPFGHLVAQWQQVVIFVAVASMLVGALAAITQVSIKRLLAYSSIGHAGFMLMAVAAHSPEGVQAMLIYLAVYIFMSAGAFGCVLLMRRQGIYIETIRDMAGLAQTHPAYAIAFSIFMFSMAGIPPLAVVGVICSVIAGYYYIKIVKIMYFDEPVAAFDGNVPCLLRAGIVLTSAATLLFFVVPTPLVLAAKAAADALMP